MTVREMGGFLLVVTLLIAVAMVHPAIELLLIVPALGIGLQLWFERSIQ